MFEGFVFVTKYNTLAGEIMYFLNNLESIKRNIWRFCIREWSSNFEGI